MKQRKKMSQSVPGNFYQDYSRLFGNGTMSRLRPKISLSWTMDTWLATEQCQVHDEMYPFILNILLRQ